MKSAMIEDEAYSEGLTQLKGKTGYPADLHVHHIFFE